MLRGHNWAVLSLIALNSCAEAGLLVGGRNAVAEPQFSPVSQASSQSSEALVISSILASLSSAAAAQSASEATSASVASTTFTPFSSTTSTIAESSSFVISSSSASVFISTSSLSSITTPSPASTPASTSMTTPSAAPTGVFTPTASPSSSITADSTSSSPTIDSHTRIIILASCLSALGLILIVVALILVRRYRRRQSPFSPFNRRGASPIDDDEIATWRGNSQPMAKTPSMHVRSASSIVFQPQPGLTWTATSSPESFSPAASPPPGSGEALPYPPPALIAQAPNARSGLTDGVIPGDAPFVAPARRQSRRLSKAVSAGHVRSKSRRSSVSASSIREPRTSTSNSQWAEPEDWDVHRKRSNSAPRPPKTALGRTSMGDDVRLGGLSPRPYTAADLPHSEIPGSAY